MRPWTRCSPATGTTGTRWPGSTASRPAAGWVAPSSPAANHARLEDLPERLRRRPRTGARVRPPDAGPGPGHPARRAAQPAHRGGVQRVLVPQGTRSPGGQAPPHGRVLPSPRRGGRLEPPLRHEGLPPVPVRGAGRPGWDRATGDRTARRGQGGVISGRPQEVRPGRPRAALVPHAGLDPGPRPSRQPPGPGDPARLPRRIGRRSRGPRLPGQGLAGRSGRLPVDVPTHRRMAGGEGPGRSRRCLPIRPRTAARAVRRTPTPGTRPVPAGRARAGRSRPRRPSRGDSAPSAATAPSTPSEATAPSAPSTPSTPSTERSPS